MTKLYGSILKNNFKKWLQEDITTETLETTTRKILYTRFVENIYAFLKKHRYDIQGSKEDIGNELVSGIYNGQMPGIQRNKEWYLEDYEYWNLKIPTEVWIAFFKYWGAQLPELSENTSLHAAIQDYLWWQLNIPDSPNGKYVENLIMGDTTDETSSSESDEGDPYLQDQLQDTN
jgi:hypothetical protein